MRREELMPDTLDEVSRCKQQQQQQQSHFSSLAAVCTRQLNNNQVRQYTQQYSMGSSAVVAGYQSAMMDNDDENDDDIEVDIPMSPQHRFHLRAVTDHHIIHSCSTVLSCWFADTTGSCLGYLAMIQITTTGYDVILTLFGC